eukprot:g11306.t1
MGNMCCKRRIIQGDLKDANSLAAARGQLWSATPNVRDNKAADPAAVKAMVDLYNQCKGDIAELAKKTGSSAIKGGINSFVRTSHIGQKCRQKWVFHPSNAKLLKANPPADARDFAQKLVTGAYSN